MHRRQLPEKDRAGQGRCLQPRPVGGSVALADVAGRTVAVDVLTGTTTDELWAPPAVPGAVPSVRGVDEWLTVIAAGQAVGVRAEATVRQHPRPGVVCRPVRDAEPVPVLLAWWAGGPAAAR